MYCPSLLYFHKKNYFNFFSSLFSNHFFLIEKLVDVSFFSSIFFFVFSLIFLFPYFIGILFSFISFLFLIVSFVNRIPVLFVYNNKTADKILNQLFETISAISSKKAFFYSFAIVHFSTRLPRHIDFGIIKTI